ncbi:hypothetical protein D3C77_286990 [compost metagenome]
MRHALHISLHRKDDDRERNSSRSNQGRPRAAEKGSECPKTFLAVEVISNHPSQKRHRQNTRNHTSQQHEIYKLQAMAQPPKTELYFGLVQPQYTCCISLVKSCLEQWHVHSVNALQSKKDQAHLQAPGSMAPNVVTVQQLAVTGRV